MKTSSAFLTSVAVASAAAGFLVWEDNAVSVQGITLASSRLPQAFDGMVIAHVSDLHNKNFGGRLLRRIEKIKPELIAVTGDLIDRHRPNFNIAYDFIRGASKIAPVVCVAGNHEGALEKFDAFRDMITEAGAIYPDNEKLQLERGEEFINIIGVRDPKFYQTEYSDGKAEFGSVLEELVSGGEDEFNLLLSHRPEMIDLYSILGIDAALCGHAHGGQVRLPFVPGLYAPHQGILPKYTCGLYKKAQLQMVVSRGLGNSNFPFRIFNRPQLVAITLRKA